MLLRSIISNINVKITIVVMHLEKCVHIVLSSLKVEKRLNFQVTFYEVHIEGTGIQLTTLLKKKKKEGRKRIICQQISVNIRDVDLVLNSFIP